jgi:hypothetical protein
MICPTVAFNLILNKKLPAIIIKIACLIAWERLADSTVYIDHLHV